MNQAETQVLVSHRAPLIRAGLVAALSTRHTLQVRAEPDAGHAGAMGASTAGCDVIVTDPRSALWVLMRQAADGSAATAAILVVVDAAEGETLAPAWRIGVRGYASLATSRSALILGVEALASGLAFRCPTVRLPADGRVDPPPPRGGLAPAALRRVREHIDAQLSRKLEIPELAALAHLSEGHFTRAFRQSVGISPARYIGLRRIALASERIRDSDSALGEIALATGFAGQSHFSRLFTNQMGETPSEFRRRHR